MIAFLRDWLTHPMRHPPVQQALPPVPGQYLQRKPHLLLHWVALLRMLQPLANSILAWQD